MLEIVVFVSLRGEVEHALGETRSDVSPSRLKCDLCVNDRHGDAFLHPQKRNTTMIFLAFHILRDHDYIWKDYLS